jgi:hypothetical protein
MDILTIRCNRSAHNQLKSDQKNSSARRHAGCGKLLGCPSGPLSCYYYQILCLDVVDIHVLSIWHQDMWKNIHWVFLVYWISAIFLPIFGIFNVFLPFLPFYTLFNSCYIRLLITMNTEHAITLEQHLVMFYFVRAAIIIFIWLYPTWLRFWDSGSLVESKWCEYVIIEADSHLKLLPTSILDIYKVLEHIAMLSMGIQ